LATYLGRGEAGTLEAEAEPFFGLRAIDEERSHLFFGHGPHPASRLLAAGVPVVATAIGGTNELVSSATGTLVSPADPRALAEGIRALLADRDGAALRAAAARDLVRTTHSTDAMVASVSALYESLLSR